ncbi:MAG: DUF397 domain-containing protein [Pseudonocardiaceae bacterium]
MTRPEPGTFLWHTSSYSAESGGCVEVARAPERVLVRDSKNPVGPALAVPPAPGRRSSPPSPADHRVATPAAARISPRLSNRLPGVVAR